MKELLEQVEIASKSHPDLSLIELIDYVTSTKYPTRDYYHDAFDAQNSTKTQKWDLSNYDLLQAFKQHNKLRKVVS
jgi:hypothetical protein